MYLSRLKLNALSREVARDIGDASELHRTIMGAFPNASNGHSPRALYNVLHRLEVNRRTGSVTLYVQSKSVPNWDALPDGYVVVNELPEIAVKPIGDLLKAIAPGRRLRFRLRANPTRKIDTKTQADGVRRHGRRVPVRGELAQIQWLQRQADRNGFGVTTVSIESSGSAELSRSRSTGRTFQGVLFEGTLVVIHGDAFQRALTAGIGPGKAFGFGMLSIASE